MTILGEYIAKLEEANQALLARLQKIADMGYKPAAATTTTAKRAARKGGAR